MVAAREAAYRRLSPHAPPGPRAGHDLAFVLPDLALGGAQRTATRLLAGWSERSRRVCLITIGGADEDFFAPSGAVERVALDLKHPSTYLAAALAANFGRVRRLRAAIRASGAPRVLSFVAGTNVLSLLATRGLDLRVVISERNDPRRQDIGPRWDWLRRRTYRWADVVAANSAAAMESLAAYVPQSRLMYVANPVEMPAEVPGPKRRAPVFVAVGRLTRQKGFDVLLRAFAAAGPTLSGWRLVLVGDGEERAALELLSRQLGISDRVEWPGAVANPAPFYARSSAFVLSSRFEGTANSLLEAMAWQLPVIATRAAAAESEIEDGVSGLVVPAEDVVALSAAMCKLAANSALREQLGQSAVSRLGGRSLPDVLAAWDSVLRL